MTINNTGNKYKFAAIQARRHNPNNDLMVQRMKKDGTWGKPLKTRRFGNETDEQVVERLIKLNGVQFRLAQ